MRYTREQKMTAALEFIMTGSMTRAGATVGADKSTVSLWNSKPDEVWMECVDLAREAYERWAPDMMSGLVVAAAERIHETLGDARAGEAAKVMGIAFDKRQILQHRPTSISASSADIEKRLKENKEMLERLAKPKLVSNG